jgi:hypothetical protein
MLAGKPAGRACWKISIWPFRAASYMRVASAMASGGRDEAFVASLVSFEAILDVILKSGIYVIQSL